jgi:cytochrome d oxidase subunit CydB
VLDYETLRLVWWLLLGTLLIGFAVMDGFDLGAAMLLPFVARTDNERRIVLNTIGPVWEGNQVWLILGAGAIFAAWPMLYAVAFSGFYLAMFLALAAMILRPVSFKFRSEIENPLWRGLWDFGLFVSGAVPALIFGIAVGNVLQGVPFRFDNTLRMTYEGDLLGLFDPFALLCGLVSCAMLVMHGGAYLALKADQPVADRAANMARRGVFVLLALFALGGVFAGHGIDGYKVTSVVLHDGPSNPLVEDRHASQRCLAFELQHLPMDAASPGVGFRRRDDDERFAAGAAKRICIDGERRGGRRRDRDGGLQRLSVPAAVFARSQCKPHRLGCLFESLDLANHALRDIGLFAARSDLHGICLSRPARPGNDGLCRGK